MRVVFQGLMCSAHTAKAMGEDQGIDTLDELYFLKDGDVETLCKNVTCPGGAAGGSNRSANLGHLVSQKAEIYIKLAAYYLQYSEKTSQACQAADSTVQAIHTIRELYDSDGNWDDHEAPMINERD